ncbi:MAG: hypothetical protein ACLPTJ_03590 [Solirubrobacteraceae bacterium]
MGGQLIAVVLRIDSHFLADRGQRAGFVLLLTFLLSFLFIRSSARLIRNPKVTWWPGNIETAGGLHLHHVVWGIGLMMISGFLSFVLNPGGPGTVILAGLFGVGAGLTMDEFALWLYVDDVYWADEGRVSFRAVVVVALLGGTVLLGAAPFGGADNGTSIATWALIIAVDILLSAVAIMKGKPLVGLFGLFVPPIALVGSIRLAYPSSIWARHLYAPEGPKMKRARQRRLRIQERRRRWSDLIAGAPGVGAPSRSVDADQPATLESVGDE